MEFIRAGLRHRVHGCSGMEAILRLQDAGLNLELLQRIRERQRKREAVVGILIKGTVQLVSDGVSLPSGNRDDHSRVIPNSVDRTVSGRTCHSGKEYQLDRIATV